MATRPIYSFAKMYETERGYLHVGDADDWYLSPIKVQAEIDRRNARAWDEINKENQRLIRLRAEENAEYDALVAAGLREPRVHPLPSLYKTLYDREWVIVEATLDTEED